MVCTCGISEECRAARQESEVEFYSVLKYRDFGVNLWLYTAPFAFRYKDRNFVIPERFITDFYSIPRAVRWFVPNNQGIYNESAGIHDFTVRNRVTLGMSLMDCHNLFLAAMQYQDMGFGRRAIKYSAVVLLNWMSPGRGDGTMSRRVQKAAKRAQEQTGLSYHSI